MFQPEDIGKIIGYEAYAGTVYIGTLPATPDDVVAVFHYGGADGQLWVSEPTFQLKVRSSDYASGNNLIIAIRQYLLDLGDIQIEDRVYHGFNNLGNINPLGVDENQRYLFTANFKTFLEKNILYDTAVSYIELLEETKSYALYDFITAYFTDNGITEKGLWDRLNTAAETIVGSDNQAVMDDMAALQAEIDALDNQILENQQEISTLEGQILALNALIADAGDDNTILEAEIDGYIGDIAVLEDQIAHRSSFISDLTADIQVLNSQVADKEVKINQILHGALDMAVQISSSDLLYFVQTKTAQIFSAVDNSYAIILNERITTIEPVILASEAQIQADKVAQLSQIASLEAEVAQLEEDLDFAVGDILVLEAERTLLAGQIVEKNADIAALEEDLSLSESQRISLLVGNTAELEYLQGQIDLLMAQMIEKNDEISELQGLINGSDLELMLQIQDLLDFADITDTYKLLDYAYNYTNASTALSYANKQIIYARIDSLRARMEAEATTDIMIGFASEEQLANMELDTKWNIVTSDIKGELTPLHNIDGTPSGASFIVDDCNGGIFFIDNTVNYLTSDINSLNNSPLYSGMKNMRLGSSSAAKINTRLTGLKPDTFYSVTVLYNPSSTSVSLYIYGATSLSFSWQGFLGGATNALLKTDSNGEFSLKTLSTTSASVYIHQIHIKEL